MALAGVPNLQATDWYQSRPVRNQAAQQEVSLNVVHFNHPETIPPPHPVEKLSFTKPVRGALKRLGTAALKIMLVSERVSVITILFALPRRLG